MGATQQARVLSVTESCRQVVDRAGDIAATLATAPPGLLAQLAQTAPWLAEPLGQLTDAVYALDHQTAFLEAPPLGSARLI